MIQSATSEDRRVGQTLRVLTPLPESAPRVRRAINTALQVGAGAGATLAINVAVLLIAVAIGIVTGQTLRSVAIAEGALLALALGSGITMAVRRWRGLGVGVVMGSVAGYVGLLTLVVAIIVIAVVAVLCLVALMFLGYAIGSLVP